MDYELAEGVYAKSKLTGARTVNLWLGAGIMAEYSLQEAKVRVCVCVLVLTRLHVCVVRAWCGCWCAATLTRAGICAHAPDIWCVMPATDQKCSIVT